MFHFTQRVEREEKGVNNSLAPDQLSLLVNRGRKSGRDDWGWMPCLPRRFGVSRGQSRGSRQITAFVKCNGKSTKNQKCSSAWWEVDYRGHILIYCHLQCWHLHWSHQQFPYLLFSPHTLQCLTDYPTQRMIPRCIPERLVMQMTTLTRLMVA